MWRSRSSSPSSPGRGRRHRSREGYGATDRGGTADQSAAALRSFEPLPAPGRPRATPRRPIAAAGRGPRKRREARDGSRRTADSGARADRAARPGGRRPRGGRRGWPVSRSRRPGPIRGRDVAPRDQEVVLRGRHRARRAAHFEPTGRGREYRLDRRPLGSGTHERRVGAIPRGESEASTTIDLPAPVSPVRTFRPGPNSTVRSSIVARFLIRRVRSIGEFVRVEARSGILTRLIAGACL